MCLDISWLRPLTYPLTFIDNPRHTLTTLPTPSGGGLTSAGALGVGPPRRQIADKRAGFEVPDPGNSYDILGWGKGGAPTQTWMHEAHPSRPRQSRDRPTLGSESAPAALGSHSMGCSGERSWMCAFSGHDRGGTRLSPRMTVCCACFAHTGVGTLGHGGPRQTIHLFFYYP